MRVLVLGGTGFLGSYLVPKLVARGHEVTVLTRRESELENLESKGVQGVVGDLLVPSTFIESLPKQDVVVSIAMPLEFGRMSKKKIKEIEERTTQFVASALMIGERHGCPVVMTLGTSYRGSPGEVIDEFHPIDRFGVTVVGKQADRLIEQAIQQGWPPIIRMLPGQIYGPGGLFMNMVRMARSGRFGIVGRGDNHIPRVHVEDCAEAYALVLDRLPIGESFIVADDTPCTMREFMEYMGQCLGLTKVRTIPRLIARLVMGKALIETMEMDCIVTNTKAKSVLDWTLKYPSYREGLEATVAELPSSEL